MRGLGLLLALALSLAAPAIAQEKDPLGELLQGFASEEPTAREDAARAAATWIEALPGRQRGAAVERVAACLAEAMEGAQRDQRWDPRARPALLCLALLGQRDAPRRLLEAIERMPALRRDLLALLLALGELPAETLLEAPEEVLLRVLQRVLAEPQRRYERGLILQYLGQSGSYSAIPGLIELLERSPDERFPDEVLTALNQLTATRYERVEDWRSHWDQDVGPVWEKAGELLGEAEGQDMERARIALRQLKKLKDKRTMALVAELERRLSELDRKPGEPGPVTAAAPPPVSEPASARPSAWWLLGAVAFLVPFLLLRRAQPIARRAPTRPTPAPVPQPSVAVAPELQSAKAAFADDLEETLRGLDQAPALTSASSAAPVESGPQGTVPVHVLFAGASLVSPPPEGGRTVPVSELFGEKPPARTVTVAELFGGAQPPAERVAVTRHQVQGITELWARLSEPLEPSGREEWERTREELLRELETAPPEVRQAFELLEKARDRYWCGERTGEDTERDWGRVLGLLYRLAAQGETC